MGAGAYKERWAPRDGDLTSFLIAPWHLRAAFRVTEIARALAARLRSPAAD
jgi:hypothetical protein